MNWVVYPLPKSPFPRRLTPAGTCAVKRRGRKANWSASAGRTSLFPSPAKRDRRPAIPGYPWKSATAAWINISNCCKPNACGCKPAAICCPKTPSERCACNANASPPYSNKLPARPNRLSMPPPRNSWVPGDVRESFQRRFSGISRQKEWLLICWPKSDSNRAIPR